VRSPQSRVNPRGIALGLLALLTPAGLVLVNLAAYVMANLAAFRIGITVSSVVSALVLNTLTCVVAYRLGAQRWPDAWLFAPRRRRRLSLFVAVGLVLVASLSGYLTYQGLSDPRKLPNLATFLAGVLGLAVPIGLGILFREEVNPRARRRFRTR
jgi:hypothetical protein